MATAGKRKTPDNGKTPGGRKTPGSGKTSGNANKTPGKGKQKAPVKEPPRTPARKAPVREPGRKPPVEAAGAKRARGSQAPAAARSGAGRSTADLQHEIEQFLYRQAELLDAKRWQDYIDLFGDDGVYWMPASPQDVTWDGVPSIFAEDKNLMSVRMKRVLHPDAWSQRPLWGTNHVVGNVIVQPVNGAPDQLIVRSRFHMLELRRDHVRHFAGAYTHHLMRTRGGLRIKLQRVDMTNAQAAYDYVLQVWV
jgi:3-phenylpropionate/cinnamic acid dioxygenase small subunit